MSISLKEARETFYWLELLKYGFKENIDDLKSECEIIIKILVVIINRTKVNLQKRS
jgi:four helix bundle protein